MKDTLAEKLLGTVMKWTPEEMVDERHSLQTLASFKYDEYQQFSPGVRFMENLSNWLAQFETLEERRLALNFVRTRLIFISQSEMAHFVTISFPDFIRPVLNKLLAVQLGISDKYIRRISESIEFKVLLRRTLFLGLSDGAHIDLFRRSNQREISHEQVLATIEITPGKAKEMLIKLESGLKGILKREPKDNEKKFCIVVLIDDFSGSGISYIRTEAGSTGYAGKIDKALNKMCGEYSILLDPQNTFICVVLYVATERALCHLEKHIEEWLKKNGARFSYIVLSVQVISNGSCVDPKKELQVLELLRKYFDESIIDESYSKGRHDQPYLGFDECALPLILYHNSPNNSLPLLWFDEQRKKIGLFPRVSRHRGEL